MNCKDKHIALEDYLASMLRKSSALIGLPIVAVTGHNSNALQCTRTTHLNYEQLLKLCIGVDSCNKPALRVKFINSCDPLADCVQNKTTAKSQLRRMFAYDATEKTFALVINQSS